VDAVLRHEQRDPQARLGREPVRLEDPLGRGVQERPGVTVLHGVDEILARVELQHLPDLLVERHPCEQVGHAIGGRAGRVTERFGHAEAFCGDVSDAVVGVAARTAVTASFTSRPFFFIARARSPAERSLGFTYSSMPKLMSERATPMIAMHSPGGRYHHHWFCWKAPWAEAQLRIVPQL